MSFYEYAFEAPVERLAVGNGARVLHYNVMILPDWCVDALPFARYPKLRVVGEIGDHPIRGAWNPVADGRKYFILSSGFLKDAGLKVGGVTEMRFNIDDQDFVEVPPELLERLESDQPLREHWDALSAGRKRFYCHRISSAVQQATRDRRLLQVVSELKG